MNLKQHIKKILKEEHQWNLKKNHLRYEKLINKLVYEIFDEGICGFDWDTLKLETREGMSIRIVLHFTEESFQDFDYERYGKSKQELKSLIEDYLPKFDGIYIAYDTTKCREEMNESELTERCWKGYTQKGMKTMFGKRYPNCVKIKKKKSIKESIRNILLQEVNRRYDKPTPKVEELVYKWLNDYFDGATMYYDKSWETRHDFQWCNYGKEIMDITLFFHNDDSVFDDKRKTEERDFEAGLLSIPKNILNDLASDIPVRISYLKYLIEEWFDDTYLGEIQNKMGRNDIYVTEFNIDDKDARTCVPPMTKPEDVTEEDMIELILKTTLFKRDGILKREEENPGWIEKTYLEKLRNAEYDRLRG